MKLEGELPTPLSSWTVGAGGSVRELRSSAVSDPPRAAGRPLTGRQRAESTCSACGKTGHNVRNKKKCPGWDANNP